MYDEYSLASDDFEPRSCFPPRPPIVDTVPVPSVPEVSLISDRPLRPIQLTHQENDYVPYPPWLTKNAPSEKSLEPRSPLPPPIYNQEPPNIRQTDELSKSDSKNRSYSSSRATIRRDQETSSRNVNHSRTTNQPRLTGHTSPEYSRLDRYDSQSRSLPTKFQSRKTTEDIELSRRYESPRLRNQFYQTALRSSSNLDNPNTNTHEGSKKSVSFRDNVQSPQSSRQDMPILSGNKNQSPMGYFSPNNQTNSKETRVHSPSYQLNSATDSLNSPTESCRMIEKYPRRSYSPLCERDFSSHHHPPRHSVGCCSGGMMNNTDNNETVKNLLMLVRSQTEQIKCLQMQVDRLLNLHEESLKEKKNCTCMAREVQCSKAQDNLEHLNGEVKRQMEEKRVTKTDNAVKAQEDKTNPTFVEQKVSIGVMTSFEFTVQNNQHVLEVENDENMEDFRDKTKRYIHQDGFDLRKKQVPISRKPNGLENINEDTESHLSSHPRSSNFQTSTNSERQTPVNACQIDDSHQRLYQNDNSEDLPIRTMNSHGHNKHLFKETNKREMSQNHNFQNQNTYDTRTDEQYKSNCLDDSIVFNTEELNIADRPPPTPEPSIHVEMQEYSSDESDSPVKHTPNVGWTFYNNVLGQVNHILRNSPLDENNPENKPRTKTKSNVRNKDKRVDPVKAATLEQLAKMGISFIDREENNQNAKRLNFEASYYPKIDADLNVAQGTSTMTDTNTSMKMKALALKYLSDDQLSDFAIQKQRAEALKQVMVSNVDGTNLSIATMKYLQRYQLLPGVQNNFEDCNVSEPVNTPMLKMNQEKRAKPEQKAIEKRKDGNQSPKIDKMLNNKILDITTLKNQPKLL